MRTLIILNRPLTTKSVLQGRILIGCFIFTRNIAPSFFDNLNSYAHWLYYIGKLNCKNANFKLQLNSDIIFQIFDDRRLHQSRGHYALLWFSVWAGRTLPLQLPVPYGSKWQDWCTVSPQKHCWIPSQLEEVPIPELGGKCSWGVSRQWLCRLNF